MSVESVEGKDRNARRKLLRKYEGDLNRRLQYREGSLINTHYLIYKQADKDFDAATKAYRTAALKLVESRTSATLAANLRKQLLEAYGDVSTMKRQLHGHIKREKALRGRTQRYLSLHRQHAAASHETLRKTLRGETHLKVAIYPMQV